MALLYSQKLSSRWEAPDFHLRDTEDKWYSLKDFADKKGFLIVFTCNHCPYAQASWPLIIELFHRYHQNVAFAAINPNDEIAYPEDSFAVMKVKKTGWAIPFPYLRDVTQEVAKLYQAQCTPDPYLFQNENGKFRLFYHGRINDNWQHPKEIKEKNLEEAIERLIKNELPPNVQFPSMGCAIKWKR